MKEWGKKEVAVEHGYLPTNIDNVHSLLHSEIAAQINRLTLAITTPKIADLGCGNARLFFELTKHSKRFLYHGYDINESCLEFAKSHFDSTQASFMHSDLDSLDEMKKIQGYDCVVMDSTINMVENPRDLLDLLVAQNDLVLLTRVNLQGSVEKNEYKWGGMSKPSTNWSFDMKFFKEIASKHNRSLFSEQFTILIAR